MSSEVKYESQMKTQQEESHGLFDTLKEAVSNTVEVAKEAVFGKDESDASSQQPQQEQHGMIETILEKAKEVVFGATDEATVAAENIKQQQEPLKDDVLTSAIPQDQQGKSGSTSDQDKLKLNSALPAMHDLKLDNLDQTQQGLEEKRDVSGLQDQVQHQQPKQQDNISQQEQGKEEPAMELQRPTKAPAVHAGGRRIKQADHPHLGITQPTKEHLRELVGKPAQEVDESSDVNDPATLALMKQKEERQLAVQKQLNEIEKRTIHHAGKAPHETKAFPSTYHPPEPANMKYPTKPNLPNMQHNEWGFGTHQ